MLKSFFCPGKTLSPWGTPGKYNTRDSDEKKAKLYIINSWAFVSNSSTELLEKLLEHKT